MTFASSFLPIGFVHSSIVDPKMMPLSGTTAWIDLEPSYQEGLLQLTSNSHLWVISFLHQSSRDVLSLRPRRVNKDAGVFGVFALRSPSRPNPLGLSLVELKAVNGTSLEVAGLDLIHGTPVLDLKPYFEKDTVFSPKTPYIPPSTPKERKALLRSLALLHHKEDCQDGQIALGMAYRAEEALGRLDDETITLHVEGSPCFADVLQALTRARFANPPRFSFAPKEKEYSICWRKGDTVLHMGHE